MTIPLKPGDPVECIEASEPGIPLVVGRQYTVNRTFGDLLEGTVDRTFEEVPEWERGPNPKALPGVTLREIGGHYFASRFKRVGLVEIGHDSRGNTIFVEPNGVGGRRYWSDSIGGGVVIWDTCLASVEELRLAIDAETTRGGFQPAAS